MYELQLRVSFRYYQLLRTCNESSVAVDFIFCMRRAEERQHFASSPVGARYKVEIHQSYFFSSAQITFGLSLKNTFIIFIYPLAKSIQKNIYCHGLKSLA